MSYCKKQAASTVTVNSETSLVAAWRAYGHTGLVAVFRCETKLTEKQILRLPPALREVLVCG